MLMLSFTKNNPAPINIHTNINTGIEYSNILSNSPWFDVSIDVTPHIAAQTSRHNHSISNIPILLHQYRLHNNSC
jgi:hypothetical protein